MMKKKLRADIRDIVREAEARSKYTCEICDSEKVVLREGGWVCTLCDAHQEKRLKRAEEAKKKRDETIREIIEKNHKRCFMIIWRRTWDSNPRGCYTLLDFQSSSLATRSILRVSYCADRKIPI